MKIGHRHGKWKTINQIQKQNRNKKQPSLWLCKCDCGNERIVNECNLYGKGGKSCGCLDYKTKKKYHMHENKEYMISKMNENIEKSPNGCWNWKGALHRQGYGRILYKQKASLAHRVMYELINGEIEDGIKICHKCDNPKCCNPDHLFKGTQKENVQDMMLKNRKVCGNAGKHIRKLIPKDVVEIRNMSKLGITRKEIIEKYKVGKTCIHKILNYKSWADILEN